MRSLRSPIRVRPTMRRRTEVTLPPVIGVPPNSSMAGNGIRVLPCWAVRERTLARWLIRPAERARPLSPAIAGHKTRPLPLVAKAHWRSLLPPPKMAGPLSSPRTNRRWRAAACQCRRHQGMESRASGTWLPTFATSRHPSAIRGTADQHGPRVFRLFEMHGQ
jgi:hypothetical protein